MRNDTSCVPAKNRRHGLVLVPLADFWLVGPGLYGLGASTSRFGAHDAVIGFRK